MAKKMLKPEQIVQQIVKQHKNKLVIAGSWAFIIGVVISLIAGIWPLGTYSVGALIVLGLIVGFLNIEDKETNSFLFAALVLVVMASMGGSLLGELAVVGGVLKSIFSAVVVFVIPAALIVALKSIYLIARQA